MRTYALFPKAHVLCGHGRIKRRRKQRKSSLISCIILFFSSTFFHPLALTSTIKKCSSVPAQTSFVEHFLKPRERLKEIKMASTFYRLRAHNSAKNVDRMYSLRLCRTLFGEWVIMTHWGRKGQKVREKWYTFDEEALAQKKFQQVLKRRLNAQKRIGCNYQIVEEA
jgi:hypothetical protein